MLSKDFKEFVELLNKNRVKYLVVGGYAVAFYGHPRYTGDLDIWIENTPENAQKILECVNEFGFSSYGLKQSDFLTANNVIQLGYPPFRIDILTQIDGVNFDEAFKSKTLTKIDGLDICLISLLDLIKNKKQTGRPLDIDDIENLK